MLRYCSALLLVLTIPAIAASAQGGRSGEHKGSAQQQRACRSDVLRHCGDMQDKDDYAIANCMRANKARLSPTCRRSLEASDRQ